MTLPNDVCRCHDDACQMKSQCHRWLQRNDGGPSTVHSKTLRQGWEWPGEFCEHAIPTEDQE